MDHLMEDMADTLSDAVYCKENTSEKLKPEQKFKFPSLANTAAFVNEKVTKDPDAFSFVAITSQPAGFYLFAQYASEKEEHSMARMNFLEQVVQWHSTSQAEQRVEMARSVYNRFLAPKDENAQIRSVLQSTEASGKKPSSSSLRKAPVYKLKLDSSSAPDQDLRKSAIFRSTVYSGLELPEKPKERFTGLTGEAAREFSAEMQNATEHALEGETAQKKSSSVLLSENAPMRSSETARNVDKFRPRRASFHADHDKLRFRQTSWNSKAISRGTTSPSESHRTTPNANAESRNFLGYSGGAVEKVRAAIEAELAELARDTRDEVEGGGETERPLRKSGLLESLFDEVSFFCLASLEDAVAEFRGSHKFVEFVHVLMLAESYRHHSDNWGIFRVLGKGSFGEVYAVKELKTGAMCAAKFMSKSRVEKRRGHQLCWNERDCLILTHSPFVVRVRYAFHTRKELILNLDLMTGGDLAFHLSNKGRFSSVESRFFGAEILLGLEHMHSIGFVYRDLKPENVLLGKDGHIKISDLGLAVEYHDKLAGYAGTDGYMAPEMFSTDREGNYLPKGFNKEVKKRVYPHYGFSVDYWSLGCVLYEFLSGKSPFAATSAVREWAHDAPEGEDFKKDGKLTRSLCSRLAAKYMPIEFNQEFFNKRSSRLIKGLLNRDRAARFNWSRAKESRWFTSCLDWGQLKSQAIQPPFIPPQNFTQAKTAEEIDATDVDELKEVDEETDKQWKDWDFFALNAFQEEMVDWFMWRDEEQPLTNKQIKSMVLSMENGQMSAPMKSSACCMS